MANPNQAIEIMEKELYVAARRGDVVFLKADISQSDEYLCKKTHENNNIIHLAIQHERHDFVEASLRRLLPINSELIWERNSKGNTPLHVAAEVGNLSILSLLFKYLEKAGEKPLRVQNSKGNTPLHVALIHQNAQFARFLLDEDPDLAYIVNDSKEAPLHLAIKHQVNYSENKTIIAKVERPINKAGPALATKPVIGEDMLSIIEYLAENWSYVTCWPDANGSTPLHKAASLSAPYNLQVIRTILHHSPLSAEICDASGNSILHLMISRMLDYQECKDLLEIPEVYDLRNYQDQQGNTPLHIAAKNMDINMVRVLLESSTKLLNNIEGISAASLIQQNNLLELLWKRKLTVEECEAADTSNITFLRERMSTLGIDFLLSQDSKGRNVLHRLMHIKNESHITKEDFVDFIQEVLGSSNSTLVSQTDFEGDTPIHVLVRNHPDTLIYVASGNQDDTQQNNDAFVCSSLRQSGFMSVLLELCNQCILKSQEETSLENARYDKPWLVQNAEGNTPLHEALMANNDELAIRLLGYDQESATLVNKRKETPLHLLARSLPGMEPFKKEDIELMVRSNVGAAFTLDQDGMTPLLRAFQAGDLSTATSLWTISPEAGKISDATGRTFWHMLVYHPSDYYFLRLIHDQNLRSLLWSRDKDGNTPLHLIIETNRFDLLKIFFDVLMERESQLPSSSMHLLGLLEIPNKAGRTPADLLGDLTNLPPMMASAAENLGLQSAWRIPKSEMESYMDSMNVIAALLTTITFTAAFTVPGGVNQENGIPIFIGNAAFQAFMISDIIAMCLSMMTLFCLLWIVATGSRRSVLMLQDFSLSLLVASLIATSVTFMTGVYAMIYPVKPWIAIVTLLLCSLLILLVQKTILINFVIPVHMLIVSFFRELGWRLTYPFRKLGRMLAYRLSFVDRGESSMGLVDSTELTRIRGEN